MCQIIKKIHKKKTSETSLFRRRRAAVLAGWLAGWLAIKKAAGNSFSLLPAAVLAGWIICRRAAVLAGWIVYHIVLT